MTDVFFARQRPPPVLSDDLSEQMIALYRAVGIFASEEPVRRTINRLLKLSPNTVYPMHGSCIDGSIFSKYAAALLKNEFAYSGNLLGQKLETVS